MCGSFHHINLNYSCIISSPSCRLFNPRTYSTVGVITTNFFPPENKTSAADVFSSCSLIPQTRFQTRSALIICKEISVKNFWQMVLEDTCFLINFIGGKLPLKESFLFIYPTNASHTSCWLHVKKIWFYQLSSKSKLSPLTSLKRRFER